MLRRWICLVTALFALQWQLPFFASAAAQPPYVSAPVQARLAPALPVPSLPARGWFTLETPHFLVHYPPGQESFAKDVAMAAEDAHRNLVPKLQYLPEEKTHVVIADVSDAANALTRVSPYNQIVVYPVFPDNLSYDTGITPKTRDWIRQLLQHEYAHVLHLDMSAGAALQLRRLFGKVPWVTTPNAMQGSAVIEGYATLMEESSGWGRGTDTMYDMFLRTAVQEERLPTWDQILGDYQLPGWQPGSPTYLYGYSFLSYLTQKYGEAQIAEVHRRHAEQPWAGSSAAFEHVLGVQFSVLWQSWRNWLADKYSDQPGFTPASAPKQIVDTQGDVALWPRWRPDGRAILYGSVGGVVPALRLRTANSNAIDAGKSDHLVQNGLIDRSNGYAWLPDGNSVIYGKEDYYQNRLFSDLYMYDFQKRQEVRLTTGYRAYAPTVAPDGEWMAFLSRVGATSRILVAKLGTGIPLVLWSPNEEDDPEAATPMQVISLAWSPGGDQIAFAARDKTGRVDLYLLPVAVTDEPQITGALQRLTVDDAVDNDPAWSPDGRYLFFSSDRGGIYNIHVYDMQKRAMFQVTHTDSGMFSPAISPDGLAMAVSYYTADGYQLALLPVQMSDWTRWPVSVTTAAVAGPPAGAQITATPMASALTIRLQQPENAPHALFSAQSASALAPKPPTWEQDIARAIDPHDFIVRPYSVTESLAPRYWSPVWGGENGQWLSGGSTSAEDALGRHAYDLSVSFGSKAAAYDIGYEYRPGPLGYGTVAGIRLSGSRAIVSTQDNTGNQGEFAAAMLQLPDYYGPPFPLRSPVLTPTGLPAPFAASDSIVPSMSPALNGGTGELYIAWSRPGVLTAQQSYLVLRENSGGEQSRELVGGVWQQSVGGDGAVHRVDTYGLEVKQGLLFTPPDAKAPDTAVAASWTARQYVPGKYQLSVGAQLGAARLPNRFVLNDYSGDWQVRGYPYSFAAGQLAAEATLEAQALIIPIEHGVADYPLFFDNLSAAVFTDAALVANLETDPVAAAAVGMELRLTASLGYGLSKGDIRLGVARSIAASQPWRFYLGIGAGF